MKGKKNYGKIALVVFLTGLIWIWADLKQDDTVSVDAIIKVAKSANPNFWVSFKGSGSSVRVKNILLKGPMSRISDVKLEQNKGILDFEFFLVPEEHGISNAGDKPIDVTLDTAVIIRSNDKIKHLGLTVVSCDPESLEVQAVKLVEKTLTVKCYDENGIELKPENIEPAKVKIPVPGYWGGEKLVAKVILSSADIDKARRNAVEKNAYIELYPGEKIQVPTVVKIKMSSEGEPLPEAVITQATIGYVFSSVLLGEYNVKLLNEAELRTVHIRASSAARSAYENEPFKMFLCILDKDIGETDEIKRKVDYNFPEEFVRSGEIELIGPHAEAKFKLVPLGSQ